jgi:outer membrane biosynthesis protein TonB
MKLTDYISGDRRGHDAHLIEREAMRDALLQDALEGFDTVDGDHGEALRRLRRRLPTVRKQRRKRVVYRMAMAAVVAGVVAGGYLTLRPQAGEHTMLAYHTEAVSDTVALHEPAEAPETVAEPTVAPPSPKKVTPEPKMMVIAENIQIVDNSTEVETTQVFSDWEDETGFSDGASAENIDTNTNVITREDIKAADKGGIVRALRNLDPTFYVAENNAMGSKPVVTMRGNTSLPSLGVDSLRAVNMFYDYLAQNEQPREGRTVLEFTANRKGRPTKIHVIETTGNRHEAIRLLRNSPVSWPAGEMIRVVVE